MLLKNGPAEFVNFALKRGSKSSSFKPEIKTPDSGEKRRHGENVLPIPPIPVAIVCTRALSQHITRNVHA